VNNSCTIETLALFDSFATEMKFLSTISRLQKFMETYLWSADVGGTKLFQ
jgi:hypothetical protein